MEERGVEEEPVMQVFELKKLHDIATCEHNWIEDEPGTISHWQCSKCGFGKYSPVRPTLTT